MKTIQCKHCNGTGSKEVCELCENTGYVYNMEESVGINSSKPCPNHCKGPELLLN